MADYAIIGGYALLWGERDSYNTMFTKNSFIGNSFKGKNILLDHGETRLRNAPLGRVENVVSNDVGLWVTAWLKKSKKHWNMVKSLLKQKKLFYSPGTVSDDFVHTDAKGFVRYFPIVEFSLVTNPGQRKLEPIRLFDIEVSSPFSTPPIKAAAISQKRRTVCRNRDLIAYLPKSSTMVVNGIRVPDPSPSTPHRQVMPGSKIDAAKRYWAAPIAGSGG